MINKSSHLEYLPESEVLLPGVAVRRLELERAPRQVRGVVEVLEDEEDAGEVEQHLGVVGRDGERPAEALDRPLRVALDAPEVADLVVQLHRLGFLQQSRRVCVLGVAGNCAASRKIRTIVGLIGDGFRRSAGLFESWANIEQFC